MNAILTCFDNLMNTFSLRPTIIATGEKAGKEILRYCFLTMS
jgi:hypothetical protein